MDKRRYYILTIILFFYSFFLFGQTIESKKEKLNSLSGIEKGRLMHEIGNDYLKLQKPDSCLKYIRQSVNFLSSDIDLSNAYETGGMAYYFQNDFLNALSSFKTSLTYSLKTENDSIIARRYSDLGVIYDYLGAYDYAVKNYFKALKLLEKKSDFSGTAKIYNNLGIINENFEKYDIALKYYQKSLHLKKKYKFSEKDIASTYVNMGSVLEKTGQNDRAMNYYKKALSIYKKSENKKYAALCLNNIAGIRYKNNNLPEAEKTISEALTLSSGKSGNINTAKSYLILSKIFIKEKKFDKALKNLQKSFSIADRLKSQKIKTEILQEFVHFYEAVNDFQKAFEKQKEYLFLKDSISEEKLKEKTEHLQIIYETEKKEHKIANLENELTNKRILWTSAVIVLLMISFIVFLILRNKLNKSKIENHIFNQKLLRLQMNPHFIFNALTSVQSFMLENDAKKAAVYLSAFSKLTRSVLTNSREEFVSIQEEIETLDNYLKIQQLRTSNLFDYDIITDDNLDTEFYLIPPMISQPFIENSVLHAFKTIDYKGFIEIKFYKENNLLIVSVEDNGKGYLTENNKTHKSYATEITKERLKILKKQNKKTIYFKIINLSEIPEKSGTKIIFTLPLIKNTQNV